MRNRVGRNSTIFWSVAWILLLMCQASEAITIHLEYDPQASDAIDPCENIIEIDPNGNIIISKHPACANGVDRTPDLGIHLAVAAAFWEDVFEDEHTVTIRYWWVKDQAPSGSVAEVDGTGKPIEASIRVPADFNWYYDPNPLTDDEYDMRPRLFRTTHPDEHVEALMGAPPEVFEVGYNGREVNPLPLDLLGAVLHEMGHTLGLHPEIWGFAPPACSEDAQGAFYVLDPSLIGGAQISLKAYAFTDDDNNVQFDCSHLALGGIQACKTDPGQSALSNEPSTVPGLTVAECTAHQSLFWQGAYPESRATPEVAGILAVATAAGWQQVDLPRKYSLESELWHTPSMWLGNRVPDANDDVYIVNQESVTDVTMFEDGEAGNIFLSDGNSLQVFFSELDVNDTVALDGQDTTFAADAGANVMVSHIEVGQGSLLDVPFNGTLDVFDLRNEGTLRGAGTIIVSALDNFGLIRANGGTLTVNGLTPNSTFDLDGATSVAELEATVGDLVFNAELTDPVGALITVAGGRYITFAEGWHQQVSGVLAHRLRLGNGNAFEAVINGESTLGHIIELDGLGRFTSNVTLEPTAIVQIRLGGTTPGSAHDQLRIDPHVALAGELALTLKDGFVPGPGDTFVVLTYGSAGGPFDSISGPELSEGLKLFAYYQAQELVLEIGFEGGVPGAPNCKGGTVSEMASIHGSMKKAAEFFGMSVKELQEAIKNFCEP